jgi:SAM-dependent methyltransferase
MERSAYRAIGDLQDTHWWFRARRAILADQIARLPQLAATSRVLDAGCGPGGNLSMLSAFGNLSAFDCDAESVEKARALRCGVIELGALPDAVPFDGPFDLITALDVIEHLDDDIASLHALAKRLAVEGYLVITVPAFQALWSDFDEAHHHKRRYRLSEIQRRVSEAGCNVLKATYFNSHLFPIIAPVRLAQKALGLGTRAEDAIPGPRLNRMLEWIFASERFALPHLNYPIGVSVLIIAQRHGGTQ